MCREMTKKQVQHHVDDAGGKQEIEGPLGVPHRPQNGGAKIIEHGGGHAREDDAHIEHRVVDHVGGGVHHLQQGPGQADAQKDQHEPA